MLAFPRVDFANDVLTTIFVTHFIDIVDSTFVDRQHFFMEPETDFSISQIITVQNIMLLLFQLQYNLLFGNKNENILEISTWN